MPARYAIGAADLIYPLHQEQMRLSYVLRRLGPPRPETMERGRMLVEAIESLRRAERTARDLTPFDPSGL